MMGCYDFPGYYEWTFDWLERMGGELLLRDYWAEAIARDSQRHAMGLIAAEGFAGMAKYWGHTLNEESPELGFSISQAPGVFRIDITDCPSKGFLIRNGLAQHHDYCDHCIGWIGPMMGAAGFAVDHEHNHCGQCWWEMRRPEDVAAPRPTGSVAGALDVRHLELWTKTDRMDRYIGATSPEDKLPPVDGK